MMYQCGFINHNKYATLIGDVDNGRGYAYKEARDMWEISVRSVQFCFEPKTAPKKNNVFF